MSTLTPDNIFSIAHTPPKLAVVTGDDTFLHYWLVRTLTGFCQAPQNTSVKKILFSGDWQELLAHIQSKDLFSQPPVCIIDIPKPAQLKDCNTQALVASVKNAAYPVVLCLNNLTPAQQKSTWYADITRHASVFIAKPMQPKNTLNWAHKLFKHHAIPIQTSTLQQICELVEYDPICIDQCAQQLSLLSLTEPLSLQQIQPYLMTSPNQSPAYTAVDLVLSGSLAPFTTQFSDKKTTLDQTHAIYWLLIKKLRSFIRLAEQATYTKTPLSTLFSSAKIWPKQQVVAKKCLRMPRAQLYKLYQQLCELELVLKGQNPLAFQPHFFTLATNICSQIAQST